MKVYVAIVLVLALLMSACADQKVPTEVAEPTEVGTSSFGAQFDKPFHMVHSNRQHPVVRIMMAGFFQACEDFGVECVDMGVDGDDTAGVIQKAEEVVALGSSGVLHTIYDAAFYESAQAIVDAGIPLVNGHFPMEANLVPGMKAWVAPDNTAYAANAAHAMGEVLECKGVVAVTQGGLNDGENAVAKSFTETLKEDCPDIVILEPQIEGYDQVQAIAAATAILQANPEIVGAFSTTGGGPTTWAKAAEDVGKAPGDIKIISMDYSRANLDLVKSGEVYMLVGQPLYEEMYHATVLLIELAMGNAVPYENELPAPLISIDDLDKYYLINDKAESIQVQ